MTDLRVEDGQSAGLMQRNQHSHQKLLMLRLQGQGKTIDDADRGSTGTQEVGQTITVEARYFNYRYFNPEWQNRFNIFIISKNC